MAKQTKLYLHAGHGAAAVTFVNADSTTPKTICTAGSNDSDLKFLNATSTDTSTVNMQVFLNDGSTNYLIGTVPIVTLSGTNGTAASVNLLNTTYIPSLVYDPVNKAYIPVKTGWTVKVAPLVAVTSAKTVTITATWHDY